MIDDSTRNNNGQTCPNTRIRGCSNIKSKAIFSLAPTAVIFCFVFFYTQKILLTLARTEKLAAANFFSAAPPGGGEAEHGC